MADFKTYDAGGPIGSSVTPKEGVASNAGATLLGGVNNLARVGINAFEKAGKLEAANAKAAAEEASNKVVSGFIDNQLKLVDAYEGGMCQSEARTRLRANLAKAISNNPALQEDFLKAHKDLMATAGLGKVIDEGTEEEQRRAAAKDAAFKAGFGDSEAGVQAYLKFQYNQNKLQESQSQLTYQNALLERQGKITSNTSAQMALDEKIAVKGQQEAVAGMADAYATALAENVNGISQKFQTGEMTAEEAIAALNAQRLTITNTIGQQGRKTGGDYIQTVTSPLLETIDFAKKAISGEEPLASLENQTQMLITKQKLIAVTDPENAKLVAASQLLKNMDYQAGAVNAGVLRILGQATDGDKDNVNPFTKDTKSSKSFFDIIKTNLKKAGKGELNEAGLNELNTVLTDVMQGTNAYSNSVQDLNQLKEVQNFLADPNFAAYVKKNGGIPSEAVSGAKDSIQQLYMDKVIPLVEGELRRARVVTVDTKSLGSGVLGVMTSSSAAEDAVSVKVEGGNITFVSKTGEGITKARELNQKLAPVMNKMVRVTAHLNGETDYGKYYDRLFGDMIGSEVVNDTGNP